MTEQDFDIAGRMVGAGYAPYIVAELSANHNGDIDKAFEIMLAAKKAGADAVKLQTYTADTLTIDCDAPDFKIEGGLWDGRTLYELYQEASTPWEWHDALFEKGRELGITVFSAPFDETAVDLLEKLEVPVYKIASFELVDLPLVARVAATGKPMIMSTGMAGIGEIAEAVAAARGAGATKILLLHCISAYPAPVDECNLRTIAHLADAFDCAVGLSDHTLGTAVSVAAVACGASLIEKHITLDRNDGGPDSAFSLEPSELATLVSDTRAAWAACGTVNYKPTSSESGNRMFRRSLYVVEDIEAGAELTAKNIRSIRPGFGLAPKHLPNILGKRARMSLKRGTPVDWAAVTPE